MEILTTSSSVPLLFPRMTLPYRVHPLADVSSNQIGAGTVIWQFAIVLEGARVGRDCNINCHTFIEGGVVIGDRVTVKAGVFLWAGVKVEDDVFIGPNATFSNDESPRSRRPVAHVPTLLERGCSIGANASVAPGVTIGRYAMIGLGAAVTRSVPAHALVYGCPARQHGWVDEQGAKLREQGPNLFISVSGQRYELDVGGLKLAAASEG
jgi:UDP-2-acetamido-3-amino-2,3-dideoxy-glucuronate N-acetyltransferase